MIYVTGDTHGDYYEFISRIRNSGVKKGDTVIICGDFGFIFNYEQHKYFLLKLTIEPFTIAFVDGNHEDFNLLNDTKKYPIEEWNGGQIHRIAHNIVHLMRGQYFKIEDKSFFTMGGAYSIDKDTRIEGISWWEEELPSPKEYQIADTTLNNINFKVDYIITHTLPVSAIYRIGVIPVIGDGELTNYFENIYNKITFKKWFAGHFHVNKQVNEKLRVLYDDIIKL